MHKNTKHGMRKTRPYSIWIGMKTRCLNPNHRWFKHYGGRGIVICKKWLKFEGFWEDMKDGYRDNLTLDRVNPNGNYEKINCRWATKLEQSNNARNNIVINYKGKRKTLSQWSKESRIPYYCLYNRIYKYGWKIEDIFNKKFSSLKNPRKKRVIK